MLKDIFSLSECGMSAKSWSPSLFLAVDRASKMLRVAPFSKGVDVEEDLSPGLVASACHIRQRAMRLCGYVAISLPSYVD
jgi:hypothetical protein